MPRDRRFRNGFVTMLLGWMLCQFPLGGQAPKRIHGKGHDYVQPPQAQFPHLNYLGGPLVAHASYLMVFWGPYWTSGLGLTQRQHLNNFVGAVAPSAGFAGQFVEYQESGSPILSGTYAGEKSIATFPSVTSIDDSTIQSQISDWIVAGVLPVPDANTVFVILPPAGVDVTQDNASACSKFFGYHSSAVSPSGSFGYYRYIMLPYPNCGADIAFDGPVAINGMTDTLGHEMAEVETDPDANLLGAGWYDFANGEIADICADTAASIGFLNFWMQKVWSDAAGTCIGPVSGSAAIHLTISQTAAAFPDFSEPTGTANLLPGIPATFTLSTDSTTPLNLSVSGLPAGVMYSLSQPTVSAAGNASLTVSTNASPGAAATATVTATLAGQQAQFQFLVVPWQQVPDVTVTNTAFQYNATRRKYFGTITVKNTGAQAIGPTILLGYHGMAGSIAAYVVGPDGIATAANEEGPNGDFICQFPDGMLAPGQSVSANVAFSNPLQLAITFTPQVFEVSLPAACDLVPGNTGIADVQLLINEALGQATAGNDLNGDGWVNAVDIQIAINGALGFGCTRE